MKAMTRPYRAVILLVLLPIVVFMGGARVMLMISGRPTVEGQKPLNQRWFGYDTKAVDGYWGALDTPGHRAEQRFLELDLVFPTLYGTALAVSLLTASAMLGGPVPVAWVVAPVVVTVVADWVENLVQLDQLRNHIESGEKGLVTRWIRVASTATIVKLLFVSISSLALLALLLMLLRSPRPVA